MCSRQALLISGSVPAALFFALLLAGCETYPVRSTIPFQSTADLAGIRKVEVDTRNGAIVVAGDESATNADIRGERFARGSTEEDARAHAEMIGITVTPSPSEPACLLIAAEVPDQNRGRSAGASFEITLPRRLALGLTASNGKVRVSEMRGDVTISTSNGNVSVDSIVGFVEARTSNGAIEARGVQGDLDLRTSNGTILIEEAGKTRVDAVTSNGKITARGITGDPVLETRNGSIELSARSLPGKPHVSARTSNGSIRAELPRTVNAVLKMRTTNGRVSTSFAGAQAEVMEASKRRVRARLNGGGGSIHMESSNGSVSLELAATVR